MARSASVTFKRSGVLLSDEGMTNLLGVGNLFCDKGHFDIRNIICEPFIINVRVRDMVRFTVTVLDEDYR